MHELAITESLVDCVRESAGDARVLRIVLEVGRMTAVAPAAVRTCFELCVLHTSLEGAELDIVETAGTELRIRELEVI
jgi:hydrogenase nickel incorporation protein HypA/HybF